MAVASKACALPGAVSARAIETIPQQCNDPWIAEVAWDDRMIVRLKSSER